MATLPLVSFEALFSTLQKKQNTAILGNPDPSLNYESDRTLFRPQRVR